MTCGEVASEVELTEIMEKAFLVLKKKRPNAGWAVES